MMVFLLVSVLAHGCLRLNGLRSFNRLPTKEQRPTQTFFLLGFISPLTKNFSALVSQKVNHHPHFSI
jgi:hypothetical protein